MIASSPFNIEQALVSDAGTIVLGGGFDPDLFALSNAPDTYYQLKRINASSSYCPPPVTRKLNYKSDSNGGRFQINVVYGEGAVVISEKGRRSSWACLPPEAAKEIENSINAGICTLVPLPMDQQVAYAARLPEAVKVCGLSGIMIVTAPIVGNPLAFKAFALPGENGEKPVEIPVSSVKRFRDSETTCMKLGDRNFRAEAPTYGKYKGGLAVHGKIMIGDQVAVRLSAQEITRLAGEGRIPGVKSPPTRLVTPCMACVPS